MHKKAKFANNRARKSESSSTDGRKVGEHIDECPTYLQHVTDFTETPVDREYIQCLVPR